MSSEGAAFLCGGGGAPRHSGLFLRLAAPWMEQQWHGSVTPTTGLFRLTVTITPGSSLGYSKEARARAHTHTHTRRVKSSLCEREKLWTHETRTLHCCFPGECYNNIINKTLSSEYLPKCYRLTHTHTRTHRVKSSLCEREKLWTHETTLHCCFRGECYNNIINKTLSGEYLPKCYRLTHTHTRAHRDNFWHT